MFGQDDEIVFGANDPIVQTMIVDPAVQDKRNQAILDMSYNTPQAADWGVADYADYQNRGNDFEQGFWSKLKESFRRGKQQSVTDVAIAEALYEADETRISRAMRLKDSVVKNESLRPIDGNWLADLVYSNVRTAGQMWESVKAGGRGAAIAGGAGAVAGGLAGIFIPTVGEEPATTMAGAVGGLKIGAKLGLASGAAIYSYRQGLGEMYYEQVRGGADPEIAATVSSIAAIPYALIELGQLKTLTPNVKKALSKKLQGSVAKIVADIAKKYGKTWGSEVLQEIEQKVVSIIAKDTADTLSGEDIEVSREEIEKRIRQIYDEAKGAAKGMAFLPLPGTIIETAIQIVGAQNIDLKPKEEAPVISEAAKEAVRELPVAEAVAAHPELSKLNIGQLLEESQKPVEAIEEAPGVPVEPRIEEIRPEAPPAAKEALEKAPIPPEKAEVKAAIPEEVPARDILGGIEPIQQINKALREAKSIRPKLEAERKAEKRRRVGAAIGYLKGAFEKGKPAEQSIFSSTGLLKGQLSDQRYESIRPIMEAAEPGSVDKAFKSIYENKDLQYFQVLDTADAFRKLIDGEPITLREVDLIKRHFGQEMAQIAEQRAEVSPWLDRLIAFWKAGLLTGLRTMGIVGLNQVSNLSHGITETMKDAPAALIDSVIALYTKERTMAFTFRGIKTGVTEGVQKGWDYLKTGVSERDIEKKFDYKRVKFGNSPFAKAVQIYEETIFHLLGAEDQPFYYGAKARSIFSQAIAAGKNRKLKGQELADYVDEIVQFPSDEMLETAAHDAEMAVFQNRTSLGDLARQIQKSKIGEVVVPFGRTPSAVAMQIVNYTPIGVAKEIIEQIHNKQFDQRKFSQAFGRSAVGTPVLVIGAVLFAEGMMALDYPDNERERKLWELEGKKPNSIKIGGKWRSVFVLGPIGNVLLIGGYFQEALDKTGSPSKAIHTALAGGAKSFSEQTFVSGVNRAVEAIQDPERSFENFFASMAGSAVPTIVADFARAIDYTERRTQGAKERIASRVPGWRQTLEPRIDVFGQDLPRYGGNPFEVMLDPTRPAKIRRDVVVDEIRRLWDKDIRIAPTQIGTKDGYKILTAEENTVLWRRAGQLSYRALFDLIHQPYYESLNDEAKGKAIESEVKKAKDLARSEAAKIKLNQGRTETELRDDGLVTNDVARLIDQFTIARK